MRKRNGIWIALLAVWMLIGLSFSLNDYLFRDRIRGYGDESFGMLLRWDAIYWATWAALAGLLILPIARRFPLGRRGRVRNLLIIVVVGLCVAVLHRLIYLLIATPIQWWMGHDKSLDLMLVFYNLPLGFMSYCVIFVADYIFSQRDEARASREQAEVSQLKAELKDAQLRALRMQLQPHFIQNTLGSVSALLTEDVKAAGDMLARLGEFLSVSSSEKTVVTLSEELDCLRRYVAIEEVRLEDRLHVSYDEDPKTLGALVPNLILQPIIENAFKHGVRPVSSQVRIIVSAKLEDGKLCLSIKDNGRGWPDNGDGYRERVGIGNTRERLKSLYGSDGHFDLRRTPDGWTVATIETPFMLAAEQINAPVSG